MKYDYNKLLQLAYEIEGLLLVQMDRPERHSARLDSLIAEKAHALAAMTSTSSVPESEPLPEPVSGSKPQSASEPVAPPLADEEIARAAITEETEDAAGEPAAASTLDERIARQKAKDIFKAFTLNDKFRFRRELFRNSQSEFEDTLEIISGMNSLEEAEEYFYEDLCWDPDNEDVKAFMTVVAKHF